MRLAIYSAFLLSVVASSASYAKKEIVWGGQIRPRYEFRDPFANNYDSFTSMRVRTQMVASLDSDVDLMIQLQDVRLWGEEKNTLTDYSADKFDLHQGYVHLKKLGDGDHSLKIGRQMVALGGQRLIGAVEWTQQGRVFDGLQLLLAPSWGQVNLTAIQVTESDSTSGQFADDAYLTGAYATLEQLPSGSLDLYVLYNKDGAKDTDQVTMGARLAGKKMAYSYRFEGSFPDRSAQRSGRIGFHVRGAHWRVFRAGWTSPCGTTTCPATTIWPMTRPRFLTRSLRPIISTMGTPICFSISRSTLGGWGCRT